MINIFHYNHFQFFKTLTFINSIINRYFNTFIFIFNYQTKIIIKLPGWLDYSLNELENLANALDIECYTKVTQKLDKPNPKTYVGKGKLAEIKLAIQWRKNIS